MNLRTCETCGKPLSDHTGDYLSPTYRCAFTDLEKRGASEGHAVKAAVARPQVIK